MNLRFMHFRGVLVVRIAAAVVFAVGGGCSRAEEPEESARHVPSLNRFLPGVDDLPESVSAIRPDLSFVARYDPYQYGPGGRSRIAGFRPGDFAFAEYSTPQNEYELSFVEVRIVVLKYESEEAARDVWVEYPILKDHRTKYFNEEIYSDSERALVLPQLRFHVGVGLWEGVCLGSTEQRPHLEIVTGCIRSVGWTSFCDWNLEVQVETAETEPPLPLGDPRVTRIMRDVASVVMDKVGCDPPREGV